MLGGIVGLAAGLFLGFALGTVLASVFHISSFEGGAGYFAVSIAILVTIVVAQVVIVLTLYWRGTRGIWLFIGLIIVCVSIFAIAASGFGIWYATQPHVLNLNGPTPQLELEARNTVPGLSGKIQTSWRNPISNQRVFPAETTTRFATKWNTRIDKQVERLVPWPAVALAKAAQRAGNCGSAAGNVLRT